MLIIATYEQFVVTNWKKKNPKTLPQINKQQQKKPIKLAKVECFQRGNGPITSMYKMTSNLASDATAESVTSPEY